ASSRSWSEVGSSGRGASGCEGVESERKRTSAMACPGFESLVSSVDDPLDAAPRQRDADPSSRVERAPSPGLGGPSPPLRHSEQSQTPARAYRTPYSTTGS